MSFYKFHNTKLAVNLDNVLFIDCEASDNTPKQYEGKPVIRIVMPEFTQFIAFDTEQSRDKRFNKLISDIKKYESVDSKR